MSICISSNLHEVSFESGISWSKQRTFASINFIARRSSMREKVKVECYVLDELLKANFLSCHGAHYDIWKVVDIVLWFYMGTKRSEVCLDLTFNKGSISKLTSQKGLWNLNIHVNKTIIPPLTLNKSRTCKVSHYIRFFSQMNKNIILFNSIIPFWDPWDGGDDSVQLNTKSKDSVKDGICSPR